MRIPASYPMALLAALLALVPVYILITLASDATAVFDSHNLKKILSDPSLRDGLYFDSLRKNYPPRREFSTLK